MVYKSSKKFGAGATFVNSVSSSNSSLTVSPSTGAVDAVINVAHANTWAANQTFGSGFLRLSGSSSGTAILNAPAAAAGTITLPGATSTLATLALSEALTNKTVNMVTGGIGSAGASSNLFRISANITGAVTAYGIRNEPAIQSDVTTVARVYDSSPSTQATTYVLPSLMHFEARLVTIGAGSSVTTQVGFHVNAALTGAGTNYGFQGELAASAGRWNCYMSGTALNHFNGAVLIGTTTDDGVNKLQVSGTLVARTSVIASAAGIAVPAAASRTLYTNEGASGLSSFTLPTAVAGYSYTFYVQDADGVRVTAAAGDTIRIAASVSATAGRIDSVTVGSSVTIVSINATEWVATSSLGIWVVT
ncbi:MAG: hypothetical protein WC100_01665 [Sterolibacterium sp.]